MASTSETIAPIDNIVVDTIINNLDKMADKMTANKMADKLADESIIETEENNIINEPPTKEELEICAMAVCVGAELRDSLVVTAKSVWNIYLNAHTYDGSDECIACDMLDEGKLVDVYSCGNRIPRFPGCTGETGSFCKVDDGVAVYHCKNKECKLYAVLLSAKLSNVLYSHTPGFVKIGKKNPMWDGKDIWHASGVLSHMKIIEKITDGRLIQVVTNEHIYNMCVTFHNYREEIPLDDFLKLNPDHKFLANYFTTKDWKMFGKEFKTKYADHLIL